jgi:hypothetical protein
MEPLQLVLFLFHLYRNSASVCSAFAGSPYVTYMKLSGRASSSCGRLVGRDMGVQLVKQIGRQCRRREVIKRALRHMRRSFLRERRRLFSFRLGSRSSTQFRSPARHRGVDMAGAGSSSDGSSSNTEGGSGRLTALLYIVLSAFLLALNLLFRFCLNVQHTEPP